MGKSFNLLKKNSNQSDDQYRKKKPLPALPLTQTITLGFFFNQPWPLTLLFQAHQLDFGSKIYFF